MRSRTAPVIRLMFASKRGLGAARGGPDGAELPGAATASAAAATAMPTVALIPCNVPVRCPFTRSLLQIPDR